MTITPVTSPSVAQQPRGPDSTSKSNDATFVSLLAYLGNENETPTAHPTAAKGQHLVSDAEHLAATYRRKASKQDGVLPFGVPLIITAIPARRGDLNAVTSPLGDIHATSSPRVAATDVASSGLTRTGSTAAQETPDAGPTAPLDVVTAALPPRAASAAHEAVQTAEPASDAVALLTEGVGTHPVSTTVAAPLNAAPTTGLSIVPNGASSSPASPIDPPTAPAASLMAVANRNDDTASNTTALAAATTAATVARRSLRTVAITGTSGPVSSGVPGGTDVIVTATGEPIHPTMATATQPIVAQAALLGNGQAAEMRLRLHPPALGHVNVVMRRDALGALSAHLVPATREASDILNANLHHLRSALEQHSNGHGASVSVGQHDTGSGGNRQAQRERGTFAANGGNSQSSAIAQVESSAPARVARTTISTTTIDYDA